MCMYEQVDSEQIHYSYIYIRLNALVQLWQGIEQRTDDKCILFNFYIGKEFLREVKILIIINWI